jgi:hypothetical protein
VWFPLIGCLLAAGAAVTWPVAGAVASSASDAAKARAINLKTSDLPTPAQWKAGAVGSGLPRPTAAMWQKAVACGLKGNGGHLTVSPDPFGTSGKVSGDVSVDVQSAPFAESIKNQVAYLVSSDVVFVTKASQARADLTAYSNKTTLSCAGQLVLQVLLSAVGLSPTSRTSAKYTVTSSFLPLTRYGDGHGGSHMQFVISTPDTPHAFYIDEFFYAKGRAEVSFSYLSGLKPASSSLENSTIAKVMSRALSIA